MTCLEAQSNIMAFIDGKLPDDKISDFVKHVRTCPNCSEELEIYYTLIVGTRQLDSNSELSKDFKKDLNSELQKLSNKAKNAKRFKISTFGICCVTLIIMFALFYSACLNKVYKIEQMRIKAKQGDMYFYECFGNDMEVCNIDFKEEYDFTQLENSYKNREENYKIYIDIKKYIASNIEENEDE